MSRLRLMVTDHELEVVQDPLLSSGSRNYDEVEFVFADNTWNAFGTKNGVFNVKGEKEAYPMLLSSNVCKIPTQVMVTDGIMYIGLHGVNSDGTQTKTTELVKIRIERGTFSEWSSVTPPTPSIYEQIMTELGTKVAYSDIMQTTGSETQKVMSQKAVTDAISEISSTGIVFRGSCLFSELPTSASTGDEWYVTDRERMYVWNGTQWNATSEDYKSRIEEEANARMSGDNDLQSQIVNVNKDVETLDAIVGGASEIPHTDPADGGSLLAQSRLIHYANLLPTGKFGRVGARAVAWNQLCNYNTTRVDFNITVNNGVMRFERINSALPANSTIPICYEVAYASGHRLYVDIKVISKPSTIEAYINYTDPWTSRAVSEGGVVEYLTANAGCKVRIILYGSMAIGDVVEIKAWFSDMNIMNLDSLTANQFRTLFPASYYPYNTGSIIPLNPSAFKVVGKNKIDESTFVRTNADGSQTTGWMCWKTPVPYIEGATYTFKCKGINVNPVWAVRIPIYTKDNPIRIGVVTPVTDGSFNANNPLTFTLSGYPQGSYFYFSMYNSDLDNYTPYDVQCELGSTATAYEAYKETTIDTPQLADCHYINEDCYDYVVNVMKDGVLRGEKHKRVRRIEITESNIPNPTDDGNRAIFNVTIPSKIKYLSSSDVPNISMVGFKAVSQNTSWVAGQVSASVTSLTSIYVIMPTGTTKANMLASHGGDVIYYELAEEEITYVEPIRNFNVSDYTTVEPVTPQTELVNRIDVPFSVLTVSNNGIIQQITTNKENIEAEAVKRSAQISNHEKRLRNLEHKSGDYETIRYPDADYGTGEVPSGVMEYAQGKVLRGVSRVENNLVQNGNFASSDGWSTYNYQVSEVAVANNEAEQTVKFIPDASYQLYVRRPTEYNAVIGHKYLNVVEVYSPKQMYFDVTNNDNGLVTPTLVPANKWTQIATITEAQRTTRYFSACPSANSLSDVAVGDKYKYRNAFIRDLSVYFGGTIPSDADTIAEIQQNYPHLLIPSEYGTRIVDSSYSGVRAWARNLWDEVYEEGDINYNTGVPQGNSNYIRSVNFCEVTANTSIYVKGNNTIWLLWYDANYGYLGGTAQDGTAGGTTVISPPNARYFKLVNRKIVFDGKICINKSDANDGTYTPYHAPSTLSLSFQGKSAGSVYDSCEPNVEVGGVAKKRETQRIEGVDLGTDVSFQYDSSANRFYSTSLSATIGGETVSGRYKNTMLGSGIYELSMTGADKTYFVYASNKILYIYDNSKTASDLVSGKAPWLVGIKLYYELADPVVTLSDPVLDNTIKVESNGTVEAKQTNIPKVDSRFDIGYMYA